MARLVIGGCKEGDEIIFEDKEIQEIILSCDPLDRYAVEQELQKRASIQRPNQNIQIHIFSLDPWRAVVAMGNLADSWWEELFDV